MVYRRILAVLGCSWIATLAVAIAADNCSTGCYEFNAVGMPGYKCSMYRPLTHAQDNEIYYSVDPEGATQAVVDGMNTTMGYRECDTCDLHCPDSTPEYAFSMAAGFVYEDEDCAEIVGPINRKVCQLPGT